MDIEQNELNNSFPMDYSNRGNNQWMDSAESELKQWELKPTEELEYLKTLLEGIPYTNDKGENMYDKQGNLLYLQLPIINSKGAKSIYNFVLEHSTKLVTLGFTIDEKYEERVYHSKINFLQSCFINYENWELEYADAISLSTIVFTIIEMSFSRTLNGNEKIYRAKTHQSVEHNIKQESSQNVNDSSQGSFLSKLLKRK